MHFKVNMGGRGVPANTFIVNVDEILTDDGIRNEFFNYKRLSFKSITDSIRWCARHRLIHNSLRCAPCEEPMSFVVRHQLGDGFRWQCKICGASSSLRKDSFFSRSHLSLEQIVTIVYGWARNDEQFRIICEAEISSNTRNTIVDWCSFCRDICEQFLVDHPSEVIIHEQNFVNPNDPEIHTQNVENLWMRTKHKLRRQFGTSEDLFVSYLHEFIWRNKFRQVRDYLFNEFLLCIVKQYPI
ncbi:hypothetical protein TcasGA2_TC010016 [Tribolium castaneum]|uniref:ISXO2-like transposase domain-containing protein n=1 Tax=Tribolium castaneum TaxID=7070 RepID=D6WRA6_TRICA|nr:hypothetical protein TcasGA2_TC010016 [Tribolium castaneum]